LAGIRSTGFFIISSQSFKIITPSRNRMKMLLMKQRVTSFAYPEQSVQLSDIAIIYYFAKSCKFVPKRAKND